MVIPCWPAGRVTFWERDDPGLVASGLMLRRGLEANGVRPGVLRGARK
jgi:hypothetical protein